MRFQAQRADPRNCRACGAGAQAGEGRARRDVWQRLRGKGKGSKGVHGHICRALWLWLYLLAAMVLMVGSSTGCCCHWAVCSNGRCWPRAVGLVPCQHGCSSLAALCICIQHRGCHGGSGGGNHEARCNVAARKHIGSPGMYMTWVCCMGCDSAYKNAQRWEGLRSAG